MQNRLAAPVIAALLLGFPSPAGAAAAQERIVDLTQVIQPTAPDVQRKFVVRIHDALEEIPGKVRPVGCGRGTLSFAEWDRPPASPPPRSNGWSGKA